MSALHRAGNVYVKPVTICLGVIVLFLEKARLFEEFSSGRHPLSGELSVLY